MLNLKEVVSTVLVLGAIGGFFYWINNIQPKTSRPLDEVVMQTVKVPKVCDSGIYLGLTFSGRYGDDQPLIYCKNVQGENLVCDKVHQLVDGKYYSQFNCYKLEQGGK